jgi:hypothetical protein
MTPPAVQEVAAQCAPIRNGRTGVDASRYDGSSKTGRPELEHYGLARRLPLAQRSAMVQKVAWLEDRLFDDDGHRRQRLTEEVAGVLLNEINNLRHDLGWLLLDQHHDRIWPTDIAS